MFTRTLIRLEPQSPKHEHSVKESSRFAFVTKELATHFRVHFHRGTQPQPRNPKLVKLAEQTEIKETVVEQTETIETKEETCIEAEKQGSTETEQEETSSSRYTTQKTQDVWDWEPTPRPEPEFSIRYLRLFTKAQIDRGEHYQHQFLHSYYCQFEKKGIFCPYHYTS